MMQKTRRVKIVTGLKCNIRCIFCYYRDNLQAPNRSFDAIEADLLYAYRHGVREVDFSGGEPTVHANLPTLIERAKQIGMRQVCIISNGLRLAKPEYVAALKNAGLDEVLFSVHGSHPGIHDEITQVQGCFTKLSAGLHNVAEAGLDVRINTVVNGVNYQALGAICNLVLHYKPVQVNFITLNDWCFAKHLIDKFMISYSEMAPALREACDIIDSKVPAVNVRYIPFCFMAGYERFVCDHRQILYDPYEWVPRVRCRLEEQNSLKRYLAILAYGYLMAGSWKKTGKVGWDDLMDDCVVEGLRKYFYRKGKQCKSCGYFEHCDGVENTYADKFGFSELLPSSQEFPSDPLFFRNDK